jgi:hypothetical protein
MPRVPVSLFVQYHGLSCPVLLLGNSVIDVCPLFGFVVLYSVADCAVVTATRDGMNLVPYEYVVCRQGPYSDTDTEPKDSMLVVSGEGLC